MAKFYATLCLKDGGGYVYIEATNREEARKKMFAEYGKQWAFLYDESQKAEAIDRFGQHCVNSI